MMRLTSFSYFCRSYSITMKKIWLLAGLLAACGPNPNDKDAQSEEGSTSNQAAAVDSTDRRFADVQVLNYQIPGFDKLSLSQKKLVYYLYQAGLSGRDIIWDQNYRHNLEIRHALETVFSEYSGDRQNEEWKALEVYTRRVWFSNGIHHHYSMDKFKPEFSQEFLAQVLSQTGAELSPEAMEAIFNPELDAKRVNLNPEKDLIAASANNFYEPGITEAMVDAYYAGVIDPKDPTPIEYGLNSTMRINENGELYEDVWKVDGTYGEAIEKIVYWLEKAVEVADSPAQAKALELLIDYYRTGDLKTWAAFNVAWVEASDVTVDFINGFIEVYGDAKGFRATYESVVQVKDFDASERMAVVSENVQWFEDNSPLMEEHKKKNVVGVTYKVISVAGESGDASPSTPIGINLPNANWIRAKHGSKSVSLGNIITAYDEAAGEGILQEFAHDEEEVERAKKHGKLAGKLHTALHEVVGHASGQLEPGVGTPKETLKNYSSTLEEARADLVALYYLMDQKLVDLGLMESLEVGKAEYDSYIRNGLLTQLRRLEEGADIEEAHMRNRQLVAAWVFEKGQKDNVIEKIEKEGKIFYEIHDYEALRVLFGDLLREIQRIKSQGDYQAGKDLVENYGVKVDPAVHAQVMERTAPLNIPPYSGFVNPVLKPVMDENGEITDVVIEQPKSFAEQMLFYSKEYGFLSPQMVTEER